MSPLFKVGDLVVRNPEAQDVARERVDDALMIVASYGPWGADLNDAHRRQIVLADEVHRLRHLYEMAVHGRAEMRAALRQERADLAEQPAEQESVKWRDVAGFDSYEVSSNGDLRNKNTGRIIAKNLAGAGYVKADLWANGQRTQTTVHRLVAEAFLGPAEGREVNHKNGNKQDNRVSNLEWCSRSDNVNHGYYKLGIRVKPIRVTNIATGEVWCYPSANEAVRDGFHSARIHECLSGKRTSHGGFSFEYDTAPQLTIPPGYKLVPVEPSAFGVLFAVEQAIQNGDCPWQIEQAFHEYEAERKNGITKE